MLIFWTRTVDKCLKASPRIRFNKDGSLLAVTTSDNGIKILANADGIRTLRAIENLRANIEPAPSKVG